jgi:prepilin-type N-terminal cleavage/methylation domain-containing protein
MPRARGFTLIEVLIATAILVTIAAGAAQLFAVASRQDLTARQQLALLSSASAKLDEIAGTVADAARPASIAGALDRTITGYTDTIVWNGAAVERRWIVAPLSAYSATAVVIVVRALPSGSALLSDVEVSTIVEAVAP